MINQSISVSLMVEMHTMVQIHHVWTAYFFEELLRAYICSESWIFAILLFQYHKLILYSLLLLGYLFDPPLLLIYYQQSKLNVDTGRLAYNYLFEGVYSNPIPHSYVLLNPIYRLKLKHSNLFEIHYGLFYFISYLQISPSYRWLFLISIGQQHDILLDRGLFHSRINTLSSIKALSESLAAIHRFILYFLNFQQTKSN